MSEPGDERKIIPEDIVKYMRVEDGLYVVGCLERRVTLHSQQIRALNLVYSLRTLDLVPEDGVVLIVGGGVAGLTAAAGAARLGLHVTLLEREPELLHLQRNNTKRWIHPRIYDWPASDSTQPEAVVPLLCWKAAPAGEVARKILNGFEALPERNRIDVYLDAELSSLGQGSPRQVFWNAQGNHDKRVSAVILTVGFGLEREVEGVDFISYWQDDALDQAPLKGRGRTLVSGTGDGGLIDALRARLRDFRHDTFIEDLLSASALEPVKLQLLAIEKQALSRESARMGSGGAYLFEHYKKLSQDYMDILDRTVDIQLSGRLRDGVTVVLNGRESTPFSLSASILSRFLISRLYFKFGLRYRPGEFTRPTATAAGREVRFSIGAPQTFDRIICRHGPSPTALERGFPETWQSCADKLRNLASLDHTRWPIYGDVFDRSPVPTLQSGVIGLNPEPPSPAAELNGSTPASTHTEHHDAPPVNPFQTAGTLPLDHPTYVTRACDVTLMAALQNQALIAVEGDFSRGKSSLALKARRELSATYAVCYFDLQDFRTDHVQIFMRDFFEQLSQQLNRKVDSWPFLDNRAGPPTALIIDELGVLSARAARNFVPQLVQFASSHRERVRIIVCIPVRKRGDSVMTFLQSLGVENSKYGRQWYRIQLPVLDGAGIKHLVALLASRAREIARSHAEVIERLSGGHPMAVQRVCSALWDAEAAGVSDQELRAILGSEGSYE